MKLLRRSDLFEELCNSSFIFLATNPSNCNAPFRPLSVDPGGRQMAQHALLFATLIFAAFVLAGLFLIVYVN
jgi:hypothetical protein